MCKACAAGDAARDDARDMSETGFTGEAALWDMGEADREEPGEESGEEPTNDGSLTIGAATTRSGAT